MNVIFRSNVVFILILSLCYSCNSKQTKQENGEVKPENSVASTDQTVSLFMDGVVSTNLPERDLSISPDGKELFFTLQTFKREKSVIMRMTKTGEEWSEPATASFSGIHKDLEPSFSPDGSKLYFASNRPLSDSVKKRDHDIWFVDKTSSGWSEAIHMGNLINTDKEEFYPSVSNDGSLYFTAAYEDAKGTEDIYYSQLLNGEYQKPISLDSAINTKAYEFNAYIDPSERFILFSSYGRSDGFGGGDLYISVREDGKWQPSINLGADINTTVLDYCPFVSADGSKLYFTSSRASVNDIDTPVTQVDLKEVLNSPLNGFDNIYQVDFDTVVRSIGLEIE